MRRLDYPFCLGFSRARHSPSGILPLLPWYGMVCPPSRPAPSCMVMTRDPPLMPSARLHSLCIIHVLLPSRPRSCIIQTPSIYQCIPCQPAYFQPKPCIISRRSQPCVCPMAYCTIVSAYCLLPWVHRCYVTILMVMKRSACFLDRVNV
ncbi:hypothetical protein BV25DRAFT_1413582 [Artomyces pyxidatus]|uniref:Uncharacterized protein n=1 Tax=Artomyces pyxidatus TaxID=48021 RepID=A0ACB8TE09_9AGAM|nr:hypothetical protein BV25DRAFT_1413582 [Artomyces pyxidatus]